MNILYVLTNIVKSNQKVLFKVGTFYNNQHELSRAFQTDMHNKLHKLNTAPLTKFKYFFTGIYLCCSNIDNIFIKYIVLYDEIHLKYCRDTDMDKSNIPTPLRTHTSTDLTSDF
jgi:hypothetical protein